ncbi:hypothetical protein [Synechococcus sp. PCC 6312]|uniref:hypothetical protein n=1 Tax=Synechococcus sp. (strain ATCC 27167 / PCC 6312) TaxID=195253 RepID=UPI00029F2876|nr:hypothetical protein [Synechococcus sp. PCC 6312]AFY61866.1 hypothetical protein Syn6312_2786 [Synechococcus sp. PCC 6312]
MQVKILSVIMVMGLAFIFSACGGSSDTTSSSPSPASPSPEMSSPSPTPSMEANNSVTNAEPSDGHGEGGQVVETGKYHLELLVGREPAGLHIDFFVQQGLDHAPVAGAKVVGQLQLPDGSQKTLDFQYSDTDKHYTAYLTDAPAGEYRLVVLSDIQGEKVNGRFTFTP